MTPFDLHEFLPLALVHFLAVVAPGPDFAVTVTQSVRHGRSVGLFTALGIGAGISVHVLYTILGVGALMQSSAWLLSAAKIAGSAYLLYLGVRLLRAKASPAADLSVAIPMATLSRWKAFQVGFLTNATNPKATLFFLAIFATMVSATTPMRIQALYGAWMCAVNASWFALVSLVFSNPAVRGRFLQLGHWFERVMGGLLVGFAVKLLASR